MCLATMVTGFLLFKKLCQRTAFEWNETNILSKLQSVFVIVLGFVY